MSERSWRDQTEEERAEDCPTGFIPVLMGGMVMAIILGLVCYA